MATPRKKKRTKAVRPTDFKPEPGSIPSKIAQMLDWYADKKPGEILSYPVLAKVVLHLSRTPRKDAKEVDMVKCRVSAARQQLIAKYERDLVTDPGFGCRATFGDSDVLVHCVTKRARRLAAAKERLCESLTVLDEEGLIDADVKYLAEWLSEELKPVLKKLESAKAAKALLPPPPPSS
jgi:hypothetical protein